MHLIDVSHFPNCLIILGVFRCSRRGMPVQHGNSISFSLIAIYLLPFWMMTNSFPEWIDVDSIVRTDPTSQGQPSDKLFPLWFSFHSFSLHLICYSCVFRLFFFFIIRLAIFANLMTPQHQSSEGWDILRLDNCFRITNDVNK